MSWHRIILMVAAVGIVALGLATSSAAGDERYQVIVHPANPITSIDQGFLRNAYLKKEIEWPDGKAVQPVDLTTKFPVRDQFTHEVLKKTPAQLKSYWNQRIFSGKGAPPPEADGVADVIAYVLANPGAVGYLPAHRDPGGAKLIEVR
jgi:ABC-type phosphate transport system substrate-binding protein